LDRTVLQIKSNYVRPAAGDGAKKKKYIEKGTSKQRLVKGVFGRIRTGLSFCQTDPHKCVY